MMAPMAEHPKLDVCYTELMPDLKMSKTLNTPAPIYVGQEISFTIRMTNTGQTTLAFMPLRDWYDPTASSSWAPRRRRMCGQRRAHLVRSGHHPRRLGAAGQSVAVTVRFRALTATANAASLGRLRGGRDRCPGDSRSRD